MAATIDDVVRRAHDDDVRLVRFLYCDPSGVIRGKAVHVDRLASKMHEGVGVTRGQNAVNMLEAFVPIEGMEPVGEIRIVPDPDTYTRLSWVPSTASLLCDQLDHDFEDWGACTRSYLKRAIEAADALGMRVMAAFENEFYLAHVVDGVASALPGRARVLVRGHGPRGLRHERHPRRARGPGPRGGAGHQRIRPRTAGDRHPLRHGAPCGGQPAQVPRYGAGRRRGRARAHLLVRREAVR